MWTRGGYIRTKISRWEFLLEIENYIKHEMLSIKIILQNLERWIIRFEKNVNAGKNHPYSCKHRNWQMFLIPTGPDIYKIKHALINKNCKFTSVYSTDFTPSHIFTSFVQKLQKNLQNMYKNAIQVKPLCLFFDILNIKITIKKLFYGGICFNAHLAPLNKSQYYILHDETWLHYKYYFIDYLVHYIRFLQQFSTLKSKVKSDFDEKCYIIICPNLLLSNILILK